MRGMTSTRDLATINLADFVPSVGSSFVRVGEPSLSVTLVSATRVGQGHPDRAEPFSLLFEGPLDYSLEQGVHEFECGPLGTLAIFIVPVGLTASGRLYEAIFN